MENLDEFGPLKGLVGNWEGTKGLDVSYHHEESDVGDTIYTEKASFSTFGPVDNGDQSLFGLDYRMAAWRNDEEDPFHTEIGYWLWDAAAGHVMRAFVIPRGTVLLAGCDANADDTKFTLKATLGEQQWGILENPYLAKRASTVRYECTMEIGTDQWSYAEDSVLRMTEFEDLYHHTDENTLYRVKS